jgi:uncharacterized protein YyaL (SSP411 family)
VTIRHIVFAIAFAPFALAAEPAVAASARPAKPQPAPAEDRALYERLCAQVAASYDTARGGYVDKSGLPSESAVELSLRLGRDRAHPEWKERALATLAWTRALQDTMSGGFVARRPKSPADGGAFDTRTDINARRLEALVSAWQATGDASWRRDAEQVARFIDRILLDGRGGFVAAQVGDRTLEPAANGVAIHAWLAWGASSGTRGVRDFSLRSIERVWETCFDPTGVLLRRGDLGEVIIWPQLADQVEMGRALVLAWHLCGRPRDLDRAKHLGQLLIEKFEDKEKGGFMTQARPRKDGTIRRADREADENARAALFLEELTNASGDRRYHDAARRARVAFAKELEEAGTGAADWALALRAALTPETPAAPVWQTAAEPPATPQVIIFRQPRPRR